MHTHTKSLNHSALVNAVNSSQQFSSEEIPPKNKAHKTEHVLKGCEASGVYLLLPGGNTVDEED